MGLYYLLLLLLGISFAVTGLLWKGVSMSVKLVILLFVIGILCILLAIFMFLPGSAEIVAVILGLDSK